MKKHSMAALGISGVTIGLVGFVLFAGAIVDPLLGHYPGSVRVSDEHIQFNSIGKSSISRQAYYQTTDTLQVVRRWYAARYKVDPESERNLNPNGDCIYIIDYSN